MNMKRSLAWILLVLMIVFVFSACSGNNAGSNDTAKTETKAETKAAETVKKDPVKITWATYLAGVDKGTELFKKVLEDARQEFKDEMIIEVEEIPGAENYVQKMKVLLSSDQLPDGIMDNSYDIIDMASKAGKLVSLSPYLDADPEWKKTISKRGMEFNTRDGQVYGIPRDKMLIGYFYNKELFEKAGIKPAETWKEFWDNCEKFKSMGIYGVAMDTAESAWFTNLLLGAIVGTSGPEGNKFMNAYQPTDYNTPEMIEAVTRVQYAFMNYAAPDAVGGNWAPAANHFYKGDTAIFINGPWTIADFYNPETSPAGFDKKVGVSLFPEKGIYNGPSPGMLCGSRTKEAADAAVKIIKKYCSPEIQIQSAIMSGNAPDSPMVKITDDLRSKSPLLCELIDISKEAKWEFNEYSSHWYMNVYDEMSTNLYPALATNKITPEEFCKKLTEAALKNK